MDNADMRLFRIPININLHEKQMHFTLITVEMHIEIRCITLQDIEDLWEYVITIKADHAKPLCCTTVSETRRLLHDGASVGLAQIAPPWS
jgi:hypothetical protein